MAVFPDAPGERVFGPPTIAYGDDATKKRATELGAVGLPTNPVDFGPVPPGNRSASGLTRTIQARSVTSAPSPKRTCRSDSPMSDCRGRADLRPRRLHICKIAATIMPPRVTCRLAAHPALFYIIRK